MPGLYLAAILVSLAGIVALDVRFGLVLRPRHAESDPQERMDAATRRFAASRTGMSRRRSAPADPILGSPGRALAAVALGTAFFLAWDLAGIAAGVFVKGDSPALVGIDLAPHLPLEEPVFLAFLCYLALVAWAGALRLGRAHVEARGSADEEAP